MTLPPDVARRALEELGETPEIRDKAIPELRKSLARMATEEAYKDVREFLEREASKDDLSMLKWLRPRKFEVQRAEKLVVGYARYLSAMEQLPDDLLQANPAQKPTAPATSYLDMTEEKADSILQGANLMEVLPGRDKEGRLVLCVRDIGGLFEQLMGDMNIKDLAIAMQWKLDQLMLDPQTQICGLSVVEDLSGYSFAVAKKLSSNPQLIAFEKVKAKAMNDAMPIRWGDMWLVDSPWYVSAIFSVFKWFLKKKLRDRMHFIQSDNKADIMALHEKIDKDILPPNFGGNLKGTHYGWRLPEEQANI